MCIHIYLLYAHRNTYIHVFTVLYIYIYIHTYIRLCVCMFVFVPVVSGLKALYTAGHFMVSSYRYQYPNALSDVPVKVSAFHMKVWVRGFRQERPGFRGMLS